MKTKTKVLQTLNLVFYLLTIVFNFLANTLPLGGQTTGEISAKYPNLFTPANITFSIWGLIYVLLALFVLYQFGIFTKKKASHLQVVEAIGWKFALSSILNILWLFAWHSEKIYLSVIIMILLLISLIMIYRSLDKLHLSGKDKIFGQLPFSIYLAWISVATIANITTWLVSLGVPSFGVWQSIVTSILILVAASLGTLFIKRKNDGAYALVIIWALVGIIIRQVTELNSQYPVVILSASIGIGAILMVLVQHFLLKRNS